MSLCSVKELLAYRVHISFKVDAEDGEVGEVKDILFDVQTWTVVYFEVLHLLISVASIQEIQLESRRIFLSTKRAQLQQCPRADATDSRVSVMDVIGYRIHARSGAQSRRFGRVKDLICEKGSLKIKFLVIQTQALWRKSWVLLPSEYVERVIRSSREFQVNLSEEVINHSPRYRPLQLITPEFEQEVRLYYETHSGKQECVA